MKKSNIIKIINEAQAKNKTVVTIWENNNIVFKVENELKTLNSLKRKIIHKYDENSSLYSNKYRLIGAYINSNINELNKREALTKMIELAKIKRKKLVVVHHNKINKVDKLMTYENSYELDYLLSSISKYNSNLEGLYRDIEAFFLDEKGEF